MTEIRSITIVGAGQMGSGIAQVAAVAGYDVLLVDVAPGQLERATVTIQESLTKLVSKERLAQEDADAAVTRIRTHSHAEDADLLIEAATEDVDLKLKHLQAAGRRRARGRDPGVEHQLDPDHAAGGQHVAAGGGGRHALLQPGAADAAGRGDPRAGDGRRDRRGRARGGRADGQDGGRGAGRAGLHLEPDPRADDQRGRLLPDGGRGRRRGDRHGDEAGHEPPDGAADAGRPDRARHLPVDHGGAARGAGRESTARARCCAPTSRRGGWAASQAAASTSTERRVPTARVSSVAAIAAPVADEAAPSSHIAS